MTPLSLISCKSALIAAFDSPLWIRDLKLLTVFWSLLGTEPEVFVELDEDDELLDELPVFFDELDEVSDLLPDELPDPLPDPLDV